MALRVWFGTLKAQIGIKVANWGTKIGPYVHIFYTLFLIGFNWMKIIYKKD